MNILKKGSILFSATLISLLSLTSCNEEPDGSNLFSTDDLTIGQMLQQNAELSAFNAILQKCGYDKRVSTYQEYTVFAPQNAGVSQYLDSLYNDNNVRFPHNGIQETANFTSLDVMSKVALMSDSLCEDIAKYHMSGEIFKQSDISGEATCSTLLTGRSISVYIFTDGQYSGKTSLNNNVAIIEGDIEAVNGMMHICSGVIPRSDRLINDQLREESDLSIFYEALVRTGFDKVIQKENKGVRYTLAETEPTNRDGAKLYCPTECMVKWTIFAETDDVFRAAGINNFDDLARKCAEVYANCGEWYDYVKEKGIEISTGTDYENEFNVVHMFVAYHIINGGMPVDEIVYEYNSSTNTTWNFSFGYEPQEYFETMLPNTLMKVWETNPKTTKNLYINRYRQNNTLTDEIGTFGSDATHQIIFSGVQIDRGNNKSKETLNGYIHRIKGMLFYDRQAVQAQNERMRFDSSCFISEVINNGIRGANSAQIRAFCGGDATYDNSRVIFDNGYFDNIVCFNPNTNLVFCTEGNWRAHNSDQFQGWGAYDFAIKLPHVPTGDYELRIIYPPMQRGGLMQFYIGNSPSQATMNVAGIPFDAYANPYENDYFGYSDIPDEDDGTNDYGVASDQTMHVRGYMRAPASFSRGGNNSITDKLTLSDPSDPYSAVRGNMIGSTSCRTEKNYGTMMLRHIITTQRFEQGKDYWFRIKNLITNDAQLGWSFDFIELVPVGIVNSKTMTEDWY